MDTQNEVSAESLLSKFNEIMLLAKEIEKHNCSLSPVEILK